MPSLLFWGNSWILQVKYIGKVFLDVSGVFLSKNELQAPKVQTEKSVQVAANAMENHPSWRVTVTPSGNVDGEEDYGNEARFSVIGD